MSAISDASTAIDVWEFFPNTSTNILNSIDRVWYFSEDVRNTITTQNFNETYQSSNKLYKNA